MWQRICSRGRAHHLGIGAYIPRSCSTCGTSLEVDLFASLGNAHCPPGPLNLDALAHDWPGLELYAFPPLFPLIQAVLDRTRMAEHCQLLVAPYWPRQPWFSLLLSLLSGTPWQLPVRPELPASVASETAPPQSVGLATELHQWFMLGLQEGVMYTMQSARAPATTAAYQLRWRLFCSWCTGIEVVPESCGVQYVLQYLQSCLDEGLAASSLRGYLAAISTRHVGWMDMPVGHYPLVSRFMKGVRRLCPSRTRSMANWDLDVVLAALAKPPFEPLESASLKHLSMKVGFLVAITSMKRVGELHAFSVSSTRWTPVGGVSLRPNSSFLPKFLLTTPWQWQGSLGLPPACCALCGHWLPMWSGHGQ
ncbi:uncharacterized protein [Salmo salar]|uniref:Uncharacterized protein n=1 Tax=Salmo salar TaxID=8030 RepID=A0ABM3CH80_SALSA|nr:uncharacterized protein LOC106563316 [Salmo salar]